MARKAHLFGASVAFVSPEHQVLLVRVSYHGLWMLPGGGVERGEQPAQTATREAIEETGLTPDNLSLFDTHTYQLRRGLNTVALFLCQSWQGTVKLDQQEVVEAAWFDLATPPKNITGPSKRAFDLLREML